MDPIKWISLELFLVEVGWKSPIGLFLVFQCSLKGLHGARYENHWT